MSLGARYYTCERYKDDDETSGDEDLMASTFVRAPPEEDDGWESGEDLYACEREGPGGGGVDVQHVGD